VVAYETFIAEIYDSAPFFGQGRTRELDKFNAPYFQHVSGRAGRILEFGSATGSLTIPLARAGYEIDAVDISPDMQHVLTQKLANEEQKVARNINQIVADATTYIGPAPYNSIVMPEGIFIALPSAELQMAILQSCHRNLASGGRIYFDFFQPYYKVIYEETMREFSRFRTPDGRIYLLTIEFTNDKYSQIQHWKVTFTRVEQGEKRESVVVDLDFRYVFYSECKLMLQVAGFRLVELDIEYAERRGFFVAAEKI
jgi:SAM-dependent methyltransferase